MLAAPDFAPPDFSRPELPRPEVPEPELPRPEFPEPEVLATDFDESPPLELSDADEDFEAGAWSGDFAGFESAELPSEESFFAGARLSVR